MSSMEFFSVLGLVSLLVLTAYILSRMKKRFNSTQAEVFIAQFNPSGISDIRKFVSYADLNKLNINIYIDFTVNNIFGTKNLHKVRKHSSDRNVYQRALCDLIECFGSKEQMVKLLGFGDFESQDTDVFSMTSYKHCLNVEEALSYYNSTVYNIEMSGPRSFVPAIQHAIDQSHTTGPHAIFILSNGLPNDIQKCCEAMVDASWHDVFVIIIGIGDGPWAGISRLTKFSEDKKFSNSSYILHNSFPDKVDFLRSVVLTLKDFNSSLQEENRKVENSGSRKVD